MRSSTPGAGRPTHTPALGPPGCAAPAGPGSRQLLQGSLLPVLALAVLPALALALALDCGG
jgi:hypothetical protein